MPLYYITGVSGAGKSTVLSELKNRGYGAYDVDEAGPVTAKWHNDATGFVHPKSSVKKQDRTPEFIASHSWKVPRDEVKDLAEQADAKPVFLGGAIANEPEILDLFRAVFALAIDDNTLKRRLEIRTNNDWGKSAHELEYTLKVNRELPDRYRRSGYLVIDANRATGEVVADILNHVHDDR
jgi:adenylate kinase family enzyme